MRGAALCRQREPLDSGLLVSKTKGMRFDSCGYIPVTSFEGIRFLMWDDRVFDNIVERGSGAPACVHRNSGLGGGRHGGGSLCSDRWSRHLVSGPRVAQNL